MKERVYTIDVAQESDLAAAMSTVVATACSAFRSIAEHLP